MDVARKDEKVKTGRGGRALAGLGSSPFAGGLVLCVSLAFTVTLWRKEVDDTRHHRQLRFDKVAERIETRLQDRMQAYEDLLQSASGLFAALPGVDELSGPAFHALQRPGRPNC